LRVFFDTNVLVSAFITHGASSEVFEHCISSCQAFTTTSVLDETREVLSSKLRLSPALVEEICGFLSCNLELAEAGALDEQVCRDPDDDFILSGALAAGADCLITGDQDLLVLEEYRGIRILRPSDFWRFEKTLGSARKGKR
jgi:putative PIN family toxin of toxin-antitoxin system